jgi:hypothetical protein
MQVAIGWRLNDYARQMNSTHGNSVFQARAAVSAYIVLAGIWFLLAFLFLALFLSKHRPGTGAAVVVPLGVGMFWVGWLRGFRLDVGQKNLSYRDGLYRTTVVPLNEIRDAKNAWIEWRILTCSLRVPRLVIAFGSKRNQLAINAKPFRRKDIQHTMEMLRASGSCASRDQQ